MFSIYLPALLAAFVVTLLELTEVAVLVFALSADQATVAHGALGAAVGTAVVGTVALVSGAALLGLPRQELLWASAIVLAGFGAFLFRSTVRSYRRREDALKGRVPPTAPQRTVIQFAGGFTVGAIETTEAVVVLLAITAAGYGATAVVGAVAAGILLVGATLLVHERIRRIKVPWLKLGATSLLFSFALFWAGQAAGIAWPGSDLILIGFFAGGVGIGRAMVEVALRRPRRSPAGPNRGAAG
jgi:Ca2+/H+ antiporter, TMEM165/GDT1 family